MNATVHKRSLAIVVVTALAILVGLALRWRRSASAPPARAPQHEPASSRTRADAPEATNDRRRAARVPEPSAPVKPVASPQRDRVRAAALRDQIARSLAERGRRAAPPPADDDDDERPPGDLKDRTGGGPGRAAMLQQLNHDLMPLIDECLEQARERDPELAGLLAIGIETAADEELGGVVEDAYAHEQNTVAAPELIECARESALSMIVPPPASSGRDKIMLTIPVGEGA